MTDDELRRLVESNARSIQALSDTVNSIAEENRHANEELRRAIQSFADQVTALNQQSYQEREELRRAMIGIANLVSSLDQDRPTVLRKLTSIEGKVDQLLDRSQGEQN